MAAGTSLQAGSSSARRPPRRSRRPLPAPMAIPMSARVRAGASLMPSPTMATLPRCLSSRITLSLPSGRTPAMTSIHARLRADGLGGALVIAGEHDDIDAHILQLAYGLRAVWLDDVRHGDHAEQTSASAEEQRRLALPAASLSACARIGIGHLRCALDEGEVAAAERARRLPRRPAGRCRAWPESPSTSCSRDVPLLRALQVSPARADARFAARAHRPARSSSSSANALRRENVRHLRLAGGDGARLVERHDLRSCPSPRARPPS